MKKKFLGACLILLFFGAQTHSIAADDIKWGQKQKSKSSSYYPSIIGEDKEGIYTAVNIKKDWYIEKHDRKTGTLSFSKKIEVPKVKKQIASIEAIAFMNGNFVALTSVYDKKEKINNIYALKLDSKTGASVGVEKELFDVPVEKRRRRGNFNIFLSDDGKKILINHFAYYKSTEKYKDKYRLIDNDLNVTLSKDEVISKDDAKNFSTGNYIIDNDGSVYYRKSYDEYRHYIVSYDATKNFEKWEERMVLPKEAKGGEITDLMFSINAEDNLVVVGYYENDKKLEGCFYSKIDGRSKEIVISKVNKYDKAFKDSFLTARQAEKGKDAKVKNVFKAKSILHKSDGGSVLMGEFNYHAISTTDKSYTEVYKSLDVISMNFSKEGDLIAANRLPKEQVYWASTGNGILWIGNFGVRLLVPPAWRTDFFSYVASLHKDELVVLFNDNPKNIKFLNKENTKRKSMKNPSNAVLTEYSVNLKTGQAVGSQKYGSKDFDVLFMPNIAYQENDGSDVIVFGKKGKNYKFGIIPGERSSDYYNK